MSYIQLNYAFLLFRSNLEEIYRQLLFFVQKGTVSERSTDILKKFVFLNMFEKSKSWGQLNKKKISPQSKPHTPKLCFSVDLKNFLENSQRSSLFSQKVAISKTNSESLFFLTCLKRGKSWGKLDLFKQLFLIKPVKGDKY